MSWVCAWSRLRRGPSMSSVARAEYRGQGPGTRRPAGAAAGKNPRVAHRAACYNLSVDASWSDPRWTRPPSAGRAHLGRKPAILDRRDRAQAPPDGVPARRIRRGARGRRSPPLATTPADPHPTCLRAGLSRESPARPHAQLSPHQKVRHDRRQHTSDPPLRPSRQDHLGTERDATTKSSYVTPARVTRVQSASRAASRRW